MLAALTMLPATVTFAQQSLVNLIQASILDTTRQQTTFDAIGCIALTVLLALPLCGVAAATSVAVGIAQTGGLFAPNKLVPDFQNLNPVEGFRKLIKLDRLYQVLRAAIAAGVVAWLCVDVMLDEASTIASTLGNTSAAAVVSAKLVRKVLWAGALVSLALAIVDVAVTRHLWLKRNRMSKDEVKREHKESDGDPELKQERKRAHQEMLNHASVLSIKDASVLIVNPTHLATALRYKDDEDEAPIVVAQGEDELARQLVQAARAYGIPVVRDVPVARALRALQVGDEIPAELYEAVAEILKELWDHSENSDTPPT
jgi:type III secretion protein U